MDFIAQILVFHSVWFIYCCLPIVRQSFYGTTQLDWQALNGWHDWLSSKDHWFGNEKKRKQELNKRPLTFVGKINGIMYVWLIWFLQNADMIKNNFWSAHQTDKRFNLFNVWI